MRQLKYEGWIHHLARHSVACFITRGQCYISWERGMEVFDGEQIGDSLSCGAMRSGLEADFGRVVD